MNDQAFNIKFVGEVEKWPLLYNSKLPNYSRRDLTEKAWTEVGNQVNMTVSECKEKWKNIRAVFARHLRASQSATKYKRSYYLEEAMQFTIPFFKMFEKSAKIKSNVLEDDEQFDSFCDVIEDSSVQEPQSSASPDPIQQSPLRHTESAPLSPVSIMIQPQTKVEDLINVRKRHAQENIIDKTMIKYFEDKKAKFAMSSFDGSTNNPKSEALKLFLLSLMPDLESLSDSQLRKFKQRCLQVIDEIISENTQ